MKRIKPKGLLSAVLILITSSLTALSVADAAPHVTAHVGLVDQEPDASCGIQIDSSGFQVFGRLVSSRGFVAELRAKLSGSTDDHAKYEGPMLRAEGVRRGADRELGVPIRVSLRIDSVLQMLGLSFELDADTDDFHLTASTGTLLRADRRSKR